MREVGSFRGIRCRIRLSSAPRPLEKHAIRMTILCYLQRTMRHIFWTLAHLIIVTSLSAQANSSHGHAHTRVIDFPDIPGYITLACDLHIHTVFSDGYVWPNIRVQEALKDGLDAIAITDHIEHRPHRSDIPFSDANRSFKIAEKEASSSDILVINGTEITRSMPPGHANALFLEDVNSIILEDPMAQFVAASEQDAFVFWNHPSWTAQRSDGVATLLALHEELIDRGQLHGIEVVNEHTYSDEALQIALDNSLTILSTSDIHGLVDWDYDIADGGHRPVTLAFCTEKSKSALHDALMQKRTVAYFEDNLIGRSEFLSPLLEACITVEKAGYTADTEIISVVLVNSSSVNFILVNNSAFTLYKHTDVVTIPHHGTVEVQVKTIERLEELVLNFTVMNALTSPKTHPTLDLQVVVK
jgi:3',5'-nucleoside bisphosphate phosphatase